MQEEYNNKRQKLIFALANIVKKHRLSQQKSISRISAEILMTKSMWQTLEAGKKDPQFSTLFRVCEALNITLTDLDKELKEIMGNNFSLTGLSD